jgi:hypothetical protein
MPTKTRLLDDGNFIRSPDAPWDATFGEYLEYADRLLGEWRAAREAWERTPFSAELGDRKKTLDQVVSGFIDSFRPYYTIKTVRQNPAFLPVSQFFAQCRPLREPFSILHCNLEMPLHTVFAFRECADLDRVNAALNEDAPFPWWQTGPHGRPCCLFGDCVWELNESETGQSDEGVVLLFVQMTEKYRQTHDQAPCGYANTAADRSAVDTDFIPEKVRLVVWRQSHGKCAKCGGRQGLDFDFVRPPRRGTTPTPSDVQLLCRECLHEKSGAL